MKREQYPAAIDAMWLIARVLVSIPFDEMREISDAQQAIVDRAKLPTDSAARQPFKQDRDCLEALAVAQRELLERVPQLALFRVKL